MKTGVRIFMLVMLTSSLSSCEMIRGWFDVEIDTTIEGELDILTDAADLKSTEAHDFNASTTIQIMNDDLVEYQDLINAIRAKSVSIEVISVDSAGAPITGVIILADTQFGISNPNAEFIWELNSDWPIEPGFIIELPAESYSVLNQILDEYEEHPVTISADGTCNNGNIDIVLNYSIEVKVESSPL
ncbi:MAG: hypothetical protein IMY68_02610, partial [Bacteroidetes bacterium]|nr:hypothetical protein [Bacteroidota bacterium]